MTFEQWQKQVTWAYQNGRCPYYHVKRINIVSSWRFTLSKKNKNKDVLIRMSRMISTLDGDLRSTILQGRCRYLAPGNWTDYENEYSGSAHLGHDKTLGAKAKLPGFFGHTCVLYINLLNSKAANPKSKLLGLRVVVPANGIIVTTQRLMLQRAISQVCKCVPQLAYLLLQLSIP